MRPRSRWHCPGTLLALAVLAGIQAAWAPAVARATDWVKLPPARVVSQAELAAVGRFEAPPAGEKPRFLWADGLAWELRPFTVEFFLRQQGVLRRVEIGVEPLDAAQVIGRRYLVLLEQKSGGWVPVAGPNGLVPLAESSLVGTGDGQKAALQPLLVDAADREFYRRLLVEQPRFQPFGADRGRRGAGSGTVATSLYVVVAVALILLVADAVRRRRSRAAGMQRRQP